jgi:hypothetical protein
MSNLTRPRSKFSIISLVTDHYSTFRNYDTRTVKLSDYFVYVGLPGITAILLAVFGVQAQGVPDLLAAIAILTGLVFNAVLLISDLSARASETADTSLREQVMLLAEELRANISYAVILGLSLSALLGGIAMFTDTSKPLNFLLTALVVFLGLQLLLTILMILKRVRALFHGSFVGQGERIP